jgi:hypothetical protein
MGVAKLMVDNYLKDCNYQISAPINCAGGALAALKPPLRKRLPILPGGRFFARRSRNAHWRDGYGQGPLNVLKSNLPSELGTLSGPPPQPRPRQAS